MLRIIYLLMFYILIGHQNSQAQNYHVSTARSKEQMKTTFPFDISLKGIDGKIVNTADLFKKHNEPTVLIFWLTTCYPCRMEVAAIQQKYAQWKKDANFRLLVISYDFPQNYDNYVKRATEEQWQWETFHDMNREFGAVLPGELNGLPQIFVFDKAGNIAYHKRKYTTGDEDILFEKIKSLNQ